MHNLVLGLIAASVCGSQKAEAQPVVIQVYDGNDFENYSLDPPYWSYYSKGFGDSKHAHWLYHNHRYVFIDIRMDFADLRLVDSGVSQHSGNLIKRDPDTSFNERMGVRTIQPMGVSGTNASD
jgi:hypothetical protein